VQAAATANGEDAVLKVQKPHRESEHEAAALELWDGDGAVRLLAHDPERHALLIERCVPGRPLAETGAHAALDVFVDLLPRLWKPARKPFRPLAEEAAWWLDSLPSNWERFGRPFEQRLVDAGLEALRELPPTQGEQVLLHQDLHGENVLAAQREPWLAIDPKPLAGEREFGLAPIIRSFELGHCKRDVLHRLDRLSSELGLDRERARGWTIAQTLAWAFDSEYHATHLETVRWLLEGR
jgi:streptomycin 6-kinase